MKELLIKLRRNHLLILFTLGFIVTLCALFLEIDRQYYQEEKKRYIIDNWNTLFPLDKENLTLKARQVIETSEPARRKKIEQELATALTEILEGPLSIYRVELLDAAENRILIIETPEKLRQYNTYKNSLFLRFSKKADQLISSSTGKEVLGRLLITYTTPLGNRYIEKLTTKYRWLTMGIFVALTIIYLYLIKYLLLPVKRVVTYLDKAKTLAPEIIKSPGSYLERVYNNLSRDALLSRINRKIGEFSAAIPLPQLTTVYQQLPRIIRELFNYPSVSIWEIKTGEDGRYKVVNSFYHSEQMQEELKESIKLQLTKLSQDVTNETIARLFEHNLKLMFVKKQKLWWFVDTIYHSEDFDSLACVVIIPLKQGEKELSDWEIETLRLIARQLRDGINALEFQRQVIFKEKSETRINLARRLGHDLTNIIATSKLDLMNIANYLESNDMSEIRQPEKQRLFRQALKGLLNNTKFLQEIVDIYRSFSFIKHPLYRVTNINKLLDEIIDVFQLAMSRNIKIVKAYQPDLPECVVEDRLLKLAVFNLLSNALEAIQNSAHKGEIQIRSYFNSQNEDIYISIKDNGPGIRNAEGELMSAGEMDKLFLPGYTTKKEEEGEGLGLNWVWTIVTEFHRGRISAGNHPEGGAEFTISLNRAELAKEISPLSLYTRPHSYIP